MSLFWGNPNSPESLSHLPIDWAIVLLWLYSKDEGRVRERFDSLGVWFKLQYCPLDVWILLTSSKSSASRRMVDCGIIKVVFPA